MRPPHVDLKPPPFLLDETKRKGCLTFTNGTLIYFINRHTKKDLLWSFWHSYEKSPFGDDPSLTNDFFPALTSRENWVAYGETTLIKNEDGAERKRRYPTGYRVSRDRLDFYVTKEEFKQAFLAVRPLGLLRKNERVSV